VVEHVINTERSILESGGAAHPCTVQPDDFLAGGGAMGERMRAVDWSRTPLGPVASWPHSLRTALGMILGSRIAMAVAWGPERRLFYNDYYQPLLGAEHPRALGAPWREVCPELWHLLGPELARVGRGESCAIDSWYLPIDCGGRREHGWFSLSYSPIRDDTGGVGGVLAIAAETTGRVESERRLITLRALAASPGADTVEQAALDAAAALAHNPTDVPFAVIYALAPDGRTAHRLAHVGLPADHAAAPLRAVLGAPAGWPLAEVVDGGAVVLDDLPARFGELPGGSPAEPARAAILLPLASAGRVHGVLIAGISARRGLDHRYRAFLELVAGHIAAALGNARWHDDQRAAAAARQAAEAQRRTLYELFEQVPASIAVVRCADLVFEMVNRHHAGRAGLPRQLVGQRALDAFPQLRDRGFEQMIALVRLTGEPCVIKEMAIGDRWWSLVLAPLPGEGGEVDRVMSFSYEVTELVRARQSTEAAVDRLQDMVSLLDATFDGAPVGLSVYDRALRLVNINDTRARWNGLDRERVIGRPLAEVLPRDAVDQVTRRVRAVFATGDASDTLALSSATLAAPDEPRHWLVTYYPVRGPAGEVSQVGEVVVDVTREPRARVERPERTVA
jgi:PAS domain-containing protein